MEHHFLIHGQVINEKESIQLFNDEAKAVCSHNSEFYYELENGFPCIRGSIQLIESKKIVTDSYEVKIMWSQGYPFKFPLVFETGGRIPINLDWHVFETDGHCCIKAIPEEMVLCKKGISLDWFISTQLVPYFFNQSFRQENGYYYHERSHGIKGTLESFADIFKTTNVNSILNLLSVLKESSDYKATAKCKCGSNRKYKKCHRRTIRSLYTMRWYNIPDIIRQIKIYQSL